MQRYLCWTHKSTWHYRETNYTLRDVCFWSLTSWNYPLHSAHACHLQESSVTLPAWSLHPCILVEQRGRSSKQRCPSLAGECLSCRLWKMGEIMKGEAALTSAPLLCSYQALLAVRDEVLTREICFWLQSPFPPQPQGQTGNLHYRSVFASASRMAATSTFCQCARQVFLSLPTPTLQASNDCIKFQGRHTLKHLQIV